MTVIMDIVEESVCTRVWVLFCIFQVLKNNNHIFYQQKYFLKVINSYCYPGLCF